MTRGLEEPVLGLAAGVQDAEGDVFLLSRQAAAGQGDVLELHAVRHLLLFNTLSAEGALQARLARAPGPDEGGLEEGRRALLLFLFRQLLPGSGRARVRLRLRVPALALAPLAVHGLRLFAVELSRQAQRPGEIVGQAAGPSACACC